MWRPFFLAIGITTIILGLECLVIERAVLGDELGSAGAVAGENLFVDSPFSAAKQRTVTPPEWAPWSLLSVGAVIILYAVSLRPSGGK